MKLSKEQHDTILKRLNQLERHAGYLNEYKNRNMCRHYTTLERRSEYFEYTTSKTPKTSVILTKWCESCGKDLSESV